MKAPLVRPGGIPTAVLAVRASPALIVCCLYSAIEIGKKEGKKERRKEGKKERRKKGRDVRGDEDVMQLDKEGRGWGRE